MCDPTSLLAGSLALSATTTGLSIEGQRQQASAQAQHQKDLVASGNSEAALQLSQLRIQQAQDHESTARESEKARLASQKARSTAIVAAGEAGVSGNSVDAMLQEYSATLGQFKEATLRQRQIEDSAYDDKADAIRSGARYQNLSINAPVTGPNVGAALASFGADALRSYGAFKSDKAAGNGKRG